MIQKSSLPRPLLRARSNLNSALPPLDLQAIEDVCCINIDHTLDASNGVGRSALPSNEQARPSYYCVSARNSQRTYHKKTASPLNSSITFSERVRSGIGSSPLPSPTSSPLPAPRFLNLKAPISDSFTRNTANTLRYSSTSQQTATLFTATSSCVIHTSPPTLVSLIFNFDSPVHAIQRDILLADFAQSNDCIVSDPSGSPLRYVLLDSKKHVETLKGIRGYAANDVVIAVYHIPLNHAIIEDYPELLFRPSKNNENNNNQIHQTGYLLLSPLPFNQCDVKMVLEVDIPTPPVALAMNERKKRLGIEKVLDAAVGIVKAARAYFFRGEEVDDAVALTFIKALRGNVSNSRSPIQTFLNVHKDSTSPLSPSAAATASGSSSGFFSSPRIRSNSNSPHSTKSRVRTPQSVRREAKRALLSAPALTPQESKHIVQSLALAEGDFKRVKRNSLRGGDVGDNTKHFVRKEGKNSGRAVHKRSAMVHASAEQLLAWCSDVTSNERMTRNKRDNHDLPRSQTIIPNSRSRLNCGFVYYPGFSNRIFDIVLIWDKLSSYQGRGSVTYVLAYAPRTEFKVPDGVEVSTPCKVDASPPSNPTSSKNKNTNRVSALLNQTINQTAVPMVLRGVMTFEVVSSLVTHFSVSQQAEFGGLVDISQKISHSIIVGSLKIVSFLYKKFRRGDAEVDNEIFEEYSSRLRTAPLILNHNQLDVVAQAEAFAAAYNESSVVSTKLSSLSWFVPMDIKMVISHGGVSFGTGRASVDVDTSAAGVAAFLMEYCSNARMRVSRAEGNLAREELWSCRRSYYDRTFATIKRLPWPLMDREFVCRFVMRRGKEGGFCVANVPTDDVADYDFYAKSVRGSSIGITYITPSSLSTNRCSVVTYMRVDTAGNIPVAAVTSASARALSLHITLRNHFQRDTHVDANERNMIAMMIIGEEHKPEVHTEEEEAIIRRSSERFSTGGGGEKKAKSNFTSKSVPVTNIHDALVETSSYLSADGVLCLASEFIVDTNVEEVLAFLLYIQSRDRQTAFFGDDGGEKIDVEKVSPHRQIFTIVTSIVKHKHKHNAVMMPSRSFEFKSDLVWKSMADNDNDEDDFLMVIAPNEDISPVPAAAAGSDQSELGKIRSFFGSVKASRGSKIVPLDSHKALSSSAKYSIDHRKNSTTSSRSRYWANVKIKKMVGANRGEESIPQTRVRYSSLMSLGGYILASDANVLARLFHIRSTSRLRSFFDRSFEVDRLARKAFAARLDEVGADGEYTAEENACIQTGVERLEAFQHLQKKRVIKSDSPLTSFDVGSIDGCMYGRARSVVRAPIEMVLAYHWLTKSRSQTRSDTMEKMCFDESSLHARRTYTVKKMPYTLFDRELLNFSVWKIVHPSDGSIMVSSVPCEHELYPITDAVIRGKCFMALLLRPISSTETSLDYIAYPELGMSSVFFTFYITNHLQRMVYMQHYFLKLRTLEVLDAKDGVALGETFLVEVDNEKKIAKDESTSWSIVRVENLCKSYAALKRFSSDNAFFKPLMAAVITNKLTATTFDLARRLDYLSEADAILIGGGLAHALSANKRSSSEVAVEEWMGRYPSMRELDERCHFFRPLINTISSRLATGSTLGLKVRSYSVALLSLLDMSFDLVMIAEYSRHGLQGQALALGIMIGVNALLQFFLVFCQNFRNSKSLVLREMLYVVTGIKPLVDAYRVASGDDVQQIDEMMPRSVEMAGGRVIEVVSEAVPGGFFQLYFLIINRYRTCTVLLSVIATVFHVGFISATVSFDLDSNSYYRKTFPSFYGYVKNSARGTTFVCMCVISGAHFAMKMLSIALAVSVSGVLAAAYLIGDMVFYLIYRAIRGDFRYWMNIQTNWLSIMFSILIRVLGKLIVDFTAVFHFRHPNEVGGAYWTINMLMTPLSCLIAVFLYELKYIERDDYELQNEKLPLDTIVLAAGSLFAIWMSSVFVFFLLIDERYFWTFSDTASGEQNIKRQFITSKSDAEKIEIFNSHASYYKNLEPELKSWVGERFDKWQLEKPDWFTTQVSDSIPKRFKPINTLTEDLLWFESGRNSVSGFRGSGKV